MPGARVRAPSDRHQLVSTVVVGCGAGQISEQTDHFLLERSMGPSGPVISNPPSSVSVNFAEALGICPILRTL